METLANLEPFVRSAELGGFSAAARQLGLTPAAVSRNVALLEKNLSTRLFRRSTRKLTLTESGVRFLVGVRAHLDGLQSAITEVASDHGEPAGVLKSASRWPLAWNICCRCCQTSCGAHRLQAANHQRRGRHAFAQPAAASRSMPRRIA